MLDLFEAIIIDENGHIKKLEYSYQIRNKSGKTILRYDNSPHFPKMPTYPHHKHIIGEARARANYDTDLKMFLLEAKRIAKEKRKL